MKRQQRRVNEDLTPEMQYRRVNNEEFNNGEATTKSLTTKRQQRKGNNEQAATKRQHRRGSACLCLTSNHVCKLQTRSVSLINCASWFYRLSNRNYSEFKSVTFFLLSARVFSKIFHRYKGEWCVEGNPKENRMGFLANVGNSQLRTHSCLVT